MLNYLLALCCIIQTNAIKSYMTHEILMAFDGDDMIEQVPTNWDRREVIRPLKLSNATFVARTVARDPLPDTIQRLQSTKFIQKITTTTEVPTTTLDTLLQRKRHILDRLNHHNQAREISYAGALRKKESTESIEVTTTEKTTTTEEPTTSSTTTRIIKLKRKKLRVLKNKKNSKEQDVGTGESFLGGWQDESQPTTITSPIIPVETSNNEDSVKKYYEEYYQNWYKQHSQSSFVVDPNFVQSVTEAPRRKINIALGTTLPSPIVPQVTVNGLPTPASVELETTSSPDELDKICKSVSSISKQFGIKDVVTFAKKNCGLVKMYYPKVTCNQIDSVMEYCKPQLII